MGQKKRKKRYPSDLGEGAWRCLKPLPPVSAVGRPGEVSLRQGVNAILRALKTGSQGRRQLPHEFSAWSAVCHYFYGWSRNGTRERLSRTLCCRPRRKGGRHRLPGGARPRRGEERQRAQAALPDGHAGAFAGGRGPSSGKCSLAIQADRQASALK